MKRKFISLSAILVGGMLLLGACHPTASNTSSLSIEKMNGFPAEDSCFLKGVSALYAGVLDGQLIMAGGCNFPHTPVADGGKKVFYDGIYTANLSDESTLDWKQVGLLPEASAYGVTIPVGDRLICVGGNTAERSLSDVFQLALKDDMVQMDTLPSLPVTIDNMAGALLENTIYIVGGNVNGVPSSNVYSLNLADLAEGWKEEVAVPGNPRVQPVCAAQGGKLYVWGGFSTAGEGREATLSVDGYAYNPSAKEWKQVATPTDEAGTPVSLGGGVALPMGEGAVLCAGGVNKDIFLQALQGIHKGKEYLTRPVEWYQFNRKLLKYDVNEDKWTCLGDYEQGARAGAAMVSDGSSYYIINGELKPGIRTKDINRIKFN